MKALIIEEQNKAVIKEVPVRELEPDEILCRVTYCGICGTDLAIYTGETNFVRDGLIKYPVRIGHEWTGVVDRIGSAVTKFKPGDRVVSDNGVTCRKCPACRRGDLAHCENIKSVGTINCWDGGFAEYIIMPEIHLFHLPDNIDDRNAATIEPLTVSYAGITKRKITPETIVAVIGTGPIALGIVALAKTMGAGRIIAVGRTDSKLQRCLDAGATDIVNNTRVDAGEEVYRITNGHGADFVLETSGATPTVQQAIDMAAEYGTLSMVGFYETEINGLIFNRMVTKRLNIIGVMGEFGLVPRIIDYMEKTGLNLESMITREIPFSEAPDYFLHHKEMHKQDIKVLVRIS